VMQSAPCPLPVLGQLEGRIDTPARIAWVRMQPTPRPCFTPVLLREICALQDALRACHRAASERGDEAPFDFVVFSSGVPGVFNVGGDLDLFVDLITAGDRPALLDYAMACIRPGYQFAVDLELPVTSIALVQGSALGGGFEAALSCSILIAERGAMMGLPEVLFNLFPGMGAYTYLARRIGAVRAEKLIKSGQLYPAEHYHELGVVDILAEPGQGEHALNEYVRETARVQNAHRAIHTVRRIVNDLKFEELERITELWVDSALRLSERDLKVMQRLVRAQNRKFVPESAADSARSA